MRTLSQAIAAARCGQRSKIICPAHDDHDPSLDVDPGEKGGVVICCRSAGCKATQIMQAAGLPMTDLAPPTMTNGHAPKIPTDKWTALDQAPGPITLQDLRHFEYGEPAAFWEYRTGANAIIGYACRWNRPDGKQIRHRVWCRHTDGRTAWQWQGFSKPRPIYRLESLVANPTKPVIIVEGEKSADAAQRILPDYVSVSWPGGAQAIKYVNWKPLHSRVVVIWPDADQPGIEAANAIRDEIPNSIVIAPPEDAEHGWDAADAEQQGWTTADVLSLISSTPKPTAPTSGDFHAKLLQLILAKGHDMQDRIGDLIVAELLKRGDLYHHAEARDFRSAMFFDNLTKNLTLIRSDSFTSWLSGWPTFNRNRNEFKSAMAAVETESLSVRSKPIIPESYWCRRTVNGEDVIYLSNGPGSIVRCSQTGPRVVDNGFDGVLFPAGAHLAPWRLTIPKDPFSACSLFAHPSTDAKSQLVSKLWAIALPSNPACKPILALVGSVGSGKTRLSVGFTELFGIPSSINPVTPKLEEDFWPLANRGGVLTIDNADTKTKWLPDTLAAASTGASKETRELYTTSTVATLRAKSWIIITTSNPTFASDPGLADRMLAVRLNRRSGDTAGDSLSSEILQARDSGLSFIAETLCAALRVTEPSPPINYRHPDWANMAIRIATALGEREAAIEALTAAEADKSLLCVENDPVASALLATVGGGYLSGPAADIIAAIKEQDDSLEWLNPKKLAKTLAGTWSHLEKCFVVAKRDKDRKGVMVYTFDNRPALPL